jgi:hypothetical protein
MKRIFQIVASFLISASYCQMADAADVTGVERSVAAKGQGYFPVALRLADGRIAVVMRGGAPHLGIKGRLDMIFSSDEGKSWSKPTVVVDTPIDDRNPAFGQAKDGTLVVTFFRTARYDANGKYDDHLDNPVDTMVTRSADGGKTWSAPEAVDVSEIGWGSPYGRMLTLDDGTMLMNVYGGPVRKAGEKANEREDHSYLFRSADNGKTWTRFSEIGGKGFNETGIVKLPSGDLLAAMRSEPAGEVWLTASKDGGKSWSEARKITPRAVHPADMILLADGRLLMVCGYRVGPFGVVGMIGDDKGALDWEKHFTLVDDAASGDCGYPSSVLLKDGRVMTVYYAAARKGAAEKAAECGVVIFEAPK